MKKTMPSPEWKKGQTIPCPGKCGHPHVARTGPCTKTGCGCGAVAASKKKVRHG